MAFEREGGQRSATSSGGQPQPALTPEERAAVEQRDAAFESSAREALAAYEHDGKRELTNQQKTWARIHAPDRLRAAEAKAKESQREGEGHANEVQQTRRRRNGEVAASLVASFRGAAAQAIPSIENEARSARIAGKLKPDGTQSILEAVAHAAANGLLSSVKDEATRTAIRVICARLARGETVETLGPNAEAAAARLQQVLAEKAHGASDDAYGTIPDPAELAAKLANAGRSALAKATGDPAPTAGRDGAASGGAAYPVLHVPRFPEGKLRAGDEIEGLSQQQWFTLLSTPHPDGPSLVGPFAIRVAGVVVKHETFLIWTDGGKIAGWMPASEIPPGGSRRGNWLLWSDGHLLQVIRDRPEDAKQMRAHAPQMSEHDLKDRQEADAELNRDLEHFVATGSSIEHAQHQVYKAHRDVLVQLVQDSFRIFGAAAGALAAEEAIEEIGEGLGRFSKQRTKGAGKEETAPAQEQSGRRGTSEQGREPIAARTQESREIAGMRQHPARPLGEEDIARLKQEFEQLGGDSSMLKFNEGRRTGYVDDTNTINVRGDVEPLIDDAHPHPRSSMTSKAALGHELGHAAHRNTKVKPGEWNDEFRASYWAAKNLKALSPEERVDLILDAVARAKEAGVPIKWNSFMRGIVYGLQ